MRVHTDVRVSVCMRRCAGGLVAHRCTAMGVASHVLKLLAHHTAQCARYIAGPDPILHFVLKAEGLLGHHLPPQQA